MVPLGTVHVIKWVWFPPIGVVSHSDQPGVGHGRVGGGGRTGLGSWQVGVRRWQSTSPSTPSTPASSPRLISPPSGPDLAAEKFQFKQQNHWGAISRCCPSLFRSVETFIYLKETRCVLVYILSHYNNFIKFLWFDWNICCNILWGHLCCKKSVKLDTKINSCFVVLI